MAGGFRSCEHTGHQSQHSIQRYDGRSAVAEEGERQADNRGQTDAHTYVTDNLERKGRGCAEADQPAHIVLAAHTHPDTPGNNKEKQHQHNNTTDIAQFFADGGEDVV